MDEKNNQAKEEKKPLGMSLIEAYGFVGWLFIGVGLYLCISWRMNYSSWGEYFSDDNPIDRGLRFFTALLFFIGFVGLIFKRFAKKSESYTNSEEFNEDIEEK